MLARREGSRRKTGDSLRSQAWRGQERQTVGTGGKEKQNRTKDQRREVGSGDLRHGRGWGDSGSKGETEGREGRDGVAGDGTSGEHMPGFLLLPWRRWGSERVPNWPEVTVASCLSCGSHSCQQEISLKPVSLGDSREFEAKKKMSF